LALCVARGAIAAESVDATPSVPLLVVTAQAGPAIWVTEAPCGSYARCPGASVPLVGSVLVRVLEPLSIGASLVHHPYGTVAPSFPRVAMSTRSLHVDAVARYHFGAWGRISPWAQLGFGLARVYTSCADGGAEACGADPTLPTEDSVGGLSVRPSGGIDVRITEWFAANAALDVLTIANGEGHICGQGACATSPGTRIAPALLLGVSVGVGRR
jgi:hypothetical protein